jgi:two-component system nitrogen regulation response regulator NtrX
MPPQPATQSSVIVNGERLIGASDAMRQVMLQVARAAGESAHILVSGEPGTGRETIARAIHAQSARPGPFVKVDCAGHLPQDLEESLFATSGKGNQSGVERRSLERIGPSSLLYQSLGGTLFLQGVVDLPARMQLRLARVLRDREVVIKDEARHIELDHRVITAGDPSLDTALGDGRLLPDLHRRLCEFRLDVPPLRDRREDIPELSLHLVARICEAAGTPSKCLSQAAQRLLAALPWRGNGRELGNLLETLVSRTAGPTIDLDDLLAHVKLDGQASSFVAGGSLKEARARFESEYIAAVLIQHQGRVPAAAKTLGIQRSNLYRKIRRLNVGPKGRP